MINGSDIIHHCMFKMKNNNLIVTGSHSILVDNLPNQKLSLKLDDKYLLNVCNSNSFEKLNDQQYYNIYHLVLETNNKNDKTTHYGIYAEHILSESISEAMFNKYIKLKY